MLEIIKPLNMFGWIDESFFCLNQLHKRCGIDLRCHIFAIDKNFDTTGISIHKTEGHLFFYSHPPIFPDYNHWIHVRFNVLTDSKVNNSLYISHNGLVVKEILVTGSGDHLSISVLTSDISNQFFKTRNLAIMNRFVSNDLLTDFSVFKLHKIGGAVNWIQFSLKFPSHWDDHPDSVLRMNMHY